MITHNVMNAVKVLAIIEGASRARNVLPAEAFQNQLISDKMDVREHFLAWHHTQVQTSVEEGNLNVTKCNGDHCMPAGNAPFSFCAFPFLLNEQARGRLLQVRWHWQRGCLRRCTLWWHWQRDCPFCFDAACALERRVCSQFTCEASALIGSGTSATAEGFTKRHMLASHRPCLLLLRLTCLPNKGWSWPWRGGSDARPVTTRIGERW
jgi:hypothetical protein